MANPVATDQSTVLQAVVNRLIARLGVAYGLNSSNCFMSVEPEIVEIPRSHNFAVTVCPVEAQFDQGALDGAGEYLCIEQAGVIVTPHTAIKLDRVEDFTAALTNATRGLLGMKKAILKAMKTSDRLQDGSGNELLVNLSQPERASMPVYNPQTSLSRLSVTFSTDFQWDLS